MKRLLSILICLFTVYCFPLAGQTRDYTRWVNPFIGTGGHGHTFPGATMPFGMVQLSPDTRIDNWDGSSGYHYSDDIIYGFSHTHLSGTGIPDGCDILFMPTVGEPQLFAKEGDKSVNGYASKFSHADEKAEPGYYSVKLDDDAILAEMTATTRVGMHRYTFPKTDKANLVLDLNWRDKPLGLEMNFVGDRKIVGTRRSSSWAKKQAVVFVAEFSKPYLRKQVENVEALNDRKGLIIGTSLRAAFQFDTSDGKPILLKVALSFVSIAGAEKNLEAELPHWNFDKVRADAKAAWNRELSKIEVSGGTDDQTTTFYTALYHTMIQPNVFNDVDGRYKGHDGKIHQLPRYAAVPTNVPRNSRADLDQRSFSSATPSDLRRSYASPNDATKIFSGYAAGGGRRSRIDLSSKPRKGKAFPHIGGQSPEIPQSAVRSSQSEHYTVFSLWDTFRAAHPLYTIIDQRRTVDFINTFIRIYDQGGRLPVWELWGEETDTMIGYHAVSVIADAMAKGIKGFDYEKAYAAAKGSAELDHFGLAAYKKRGYISMEDENESVSKTLEYAYNDWCIAQMASIIARNRRAPGASSSSDDPETARFQREAWSFLKRSESYQNLFDPETGFMRPRRNGGFLSPFAPNEVTFGYTEANAWQYTFFVPHAVGSLGVLMGGREKLAAKLDELFTTEQKLAGREQADITGLIGQYAHGNEPSHHIAYLYNYVGQMWKTQKYVRQIMDNFYKNSPDGLIGNEDCGQMSAWYVLSAAGMYQVTPGSRHFALGTPLFSNVKFNLENGKSFVVNAPNASVNNIYVKSTSLNGTMLSKPFIDFNDISNGGKLHFEMSSIPYARDVPFCYGEYCSAPLLELGHQFINSPPTPVISAESRVFDQQMTVSLSSVNAKTAIYLTTDGSDPSARSTKYSVPFVVNSSTTVKAVSVGYEDSRSRVAEARFIKKPNDWTVKVLSGYSTQYTGGGENAIVDGIRGTTNFASGEWQGVQGKPYGAIVDLKRATSIRELGASFLQVAGPWIWMPDRIEFETSNDGTNFTKAAEIKPNFPQREMMPTIKEFTQTITPTKARYVRIRAYNFGKIPSWHPGAGGDPWVFVDEIFVR